MTPPAELEALHDDFVAELESFIDVLEEVQNELDDAESQADVEALDLGSLGAAQELFSTACLAVQQDGADRGISADLDCPGAD